MVNVRLSESVKRFTYRPEVIALAGRLHLRSILRRGYFWWACPKDGIVRATLAGAEVQFNVRSPEELRLIESTGGAGGEQRVLERLASWLDPGDVVWDVGANVGLYTVVLAKRVGEEGLVIAFEPSSRAFASLLDNLKLNHLANVRCFPLALGEGKGQAQLYSDEVIGGASLLSTPHQTGAAEVVNIVAGDCWRADENIPVPRAVKIDVEGYEWAVIRGLLGTLAEPSCELVCCEVHPARLPVEVRPETIEDLFRSVGFTQIDAYARWDKTFHLVACKRSS